MARISTAIQIDRIRVPVTMGNMSLSLVTEVPKNLTTKKARAATIRDLADQLADMVEMPRKGAKNV